jgi:hypothetical protein
MVDAVAAQNVKVDLKFPHGACDRSADRKQWLCPHLARVSLGVDVSGTHPVLELVQWQKP